MKEKEFICLANSRKPPSGRCIAGKEQKSLSWIRPISNRVSEEISDEERRFENGKKADVLDIINIPLIKHSPNLFQTKNYLIAGKYYWKKIGEYPKQKLIKLCDYPDKLWLNGYQKGYDYLNNCITETDAQSLKSSLYLITPEELTIIVEKEWPGKSYARRKVKAQFIYNKINYIIVITDPKIEDKYIIKGDNTYFIKNPKNRVFMCISLALPWESSSSELPKKRYCYKLVATVFGL